MQCNVETVEKLCEIIEIQNNTIKELYELLAQHESVDELMKSFPLPNLKQ